MRLLALMIELQGIIHPVNEWFSLHPPSIFAGSTVLDQCRLWTASLPHTSAHDSQPAVDQAVPRRRDATRRLTYRNPLRGYLGDQQPCFAKA